jgi:hypothetical protein
MIVSIAWNALSTLGSSARTRSKRSSAASTAAELVAQEHRGGVVVTGATDRVDLHLDDLVDDADRLAPLLALGVEVEEAVKHRRLARAQLERPLVGDDGLLRVAQALA